MKKFLLFIFAFCLVTTAFSQEKPRYVKPKSELDLSKQYNNREGNRQLQKGAITPEAQNELRARGVILGNESFEKCGTVENMRRLRAENPGAFGSDEEFEAWMTQKLAEKAQMESLPGMNMMGANNFGGEIITVPVVVHVIHDGTPVNTVGNVDGSNISAAQVMSQFTVLNQDFRMLNPDRANAPWWDDRAADLEIEFAPVLYNPDTGIPLDEPGIHRVDRNDMGWPAPPYATGFIDGTIKPATSWDWENVVNVWVMPLPGGLYGYAQFPSQSGLPGMPGNGGASNTDGVVMAPFTFGTTALDDGSFTTQNTEFGRTTTHELGHWVGLRHVWGDGGCTADDFCEDTPPQNGNSPFGSCNAGQNTCDDLNDPVWNYTEDLDDMKENYMDYSGDSCMNLFTQDQKDRAEIVFENSPGRGSLADSPYDEEMDPIVFFTEDSVSQENVEAEGCELYRDYTLAVRVAFGYTGSSDIVATVNATGGSAVQGTDWDFIGDNTVTFSGGAPQTETVTIRLYNDAVTEGDETIDFALSLDAGDTNVTLTDNEDYNSTTWTVMDSVNAGDKAEISLVDYMGSDDEVECLDSGELTLDITFDRFASETSWDVKDAVGNVIASMAYNSSYNQSTITETISVPMDNSYVFTIYDQFGDGICCGTWGDGSYELFDAEGNSLGTGGDFEDSESIDFCVGEPYIEQPVRVGINPVIPEIVNCVDDYTDYQLDVNISNCVLGEQDVMATLVVGGGTATEGADFEFPQGKSVTFNGEGEQTLSFIIRVLHDGVVEPQEHFDYTIEVSDSNLADLSEMYSSGTFTINDSDSPELVVEAMGDSVYESDYNCTDTSNTYMFEVSAAGCAEIDGNITFAVSQAESSVAIAGEDFNILTPTVTFNSANADETQVVEIEVLNDYMEEGDELMVLDFDITGGTAGVNMTSLSVTIKDALGNRAPEVVNKVHADFEGGLPEGWSVLTLPADGAPNQFTVSGNTGLNGMAAHITNNMETKPHEYSAYSPNQLGFLISPSFNLNGTELFDFLFQSNGEVFFGFIFDFGVVGIMPGDVAVDDAGAIVDALNSGNLEFLLLQEDPSSFIDYKGVDAFNVSDLNPAYVGQDVRLVFAWQSDFSVQNNPPIGVDDVAVQVGNFIEEFIMFADERPQYPIMENENTYYYNAKDFDIAMSVKSTSSHGCSSGYVAEQGTGVIEFISPYKGDYRTAKSFVLETENADKDAETEVSLYYTEEEIAGWEAETGRNRSDLQMFKAMDTKLIGCCGELVFDITFDDFPGETSWVVTNSDGAEVASGGPYGDLEGGSRLVETINLNDGDYKFTLRDEFGDGICCSWGNGSYSLALNGDVIHTGGEFEASDVTEFTVGDGKIEFCQDYRKIDYAPVTMTPYLDGYKVTASFESGFANINSFALSAVPAVTPGEFTATQVQEQVNISFTNRYPVAGVEYLIFEEQAENLEWVELETVAATNGTSVYNVVDYHPHNGINRYRVTYVLANGDKITPCYVAEVFYEPTNDFHVTPNPARDDITLIISDANVTGPLAMSIYDERGRLVMSDDLVSVSGVTRHSIDISHLGVGQYYIKVASGNGYERDATFIKIAN